MKNSSTLYLAFDVAMISSHLSSVYCIFRCCLDFQNAFLFMASSAQLAEKNQHHPDWRNLYNTVDVVLTTDDQACLSTFDFELAQGMDLIYSNF